MTVRPDRPLFPVPFGMPKPKRPVKDSCLLCECQGMSLTIGCVSKKVECAAVETESGDIGACLVPGVVLGFALCQFHIPRFRQRVVPAVRRVSANSRESEADCHGDRRYASTQQAETL